MMRKLTVVFLGLSLALSLAACTSEETRSANKPPIASIEFEPRLGEVPLTVHFSAAASIDPDGQIASYSWEFGDDGKGAGIFVEHEYTKKGSFIVSLTVTDDKGASSSVKRTVFVTEQSAPPFSKNRTDTAQNELVIYTRTLPEIVGSGQTFAVQVIVTTKVSLPALVVSETLPADMQLVSGDLRAAQLGLSANQKLQLTYQAKASAASGSITISGKATPATKDGAQPSLGLSSNVQVR